MIDGVLNIYKRTGRSSNQVLTLLKQATKTKKAGHNGTLDPFAEGVLSCFLGRATKLIPFVDDKVKCYEATVFLGARTTTGDIEGAIVDEKNGPTVEYERVQAVLKKFTGKISQTPPMYSAIKHDGRPLYSYARQGKTIDRMAREVIVHSLEVKQLEKNSAVLSITCSRGTYIRVLSEDIFNDLDMPSHLMKLVRCSNGDYGIDDCIDEELVETGDLDAIGMHLVPLNKVLDRYPRVAVPIEVRRLLSNGFRGHLTRFGELFETIAAGSFLAVDEDSTWSAIIEKDASGTIATRRVV